MEQDALHHNAPSTADHQAAKVGRLGKRPLRTPSVLAPPHCAPVLPLGHSAVYRCRQGRRTPCLARRSRDGSLLAALSQISRCGSFLGIPSFLCGTATRSSLFGRREASFGKVELRCSPRGMPQSSNATTYFLRLPIRPEGLARSLFVLPTRAVAASRCWPRDSPWADPYSGPPYAGLGGYAPETSDGQPECIHPCGYPWAQTATARSSAIRYVLARPRRLLRTICCPISRSYPASAVCVERHRSDL